jgi:phosphatidylglycerophosphate synthase
MLDGVMRRVIDPPLTAIGHHLATAGISADAMTGFSLTCGLLCAGSIAGGNFGLALLFLALGRIGDGLDGAIARATKPTDRGGFIDIVGDFVFYGAVPLAFAWFDPQ